MRVVGPTHGPDVSLEQHLRDWWQYSRRGLTLYPQWGDADYSLGSCDLRRDIRPSALLPDHSSVNHYDTFQTPEAHIASSVWAKRKGGRLPLRTTKNQSRTEQYKKTLDCYQDIQIRLQDDPTR